MRRGGGVAWSDIPDDISVDRSLLKFRVLRDCMMKARELDSSGMVLNIMR